MPGGFFTRPAVHEYKGREILRFEGPLGTFYLREESDKPIIFVAGGTGFAPIKAIIEHALHHRSTHATDGAVLGRAREARSVPARPARHMAAAEPQLHVHSRAVGAAAGGRLARAAPGFVHQAVLDDFGDLSGYQVYACGAPPMIDAARKSFTATRGLPADEFFADSFTYAVQPGVDAIPAPIPPTRA